MRILVVSFCSPWGMGEYTHKALVELRHQSQLFYTNSGGDFFERILNRAKYLRLQPDRFIRLWQNEVNKRLIRKVDAFKPQIILIIKGDELFPETLKELKKRRIILVNWLPDNPFYLDLKNILEAIPIYDYIFTFDPAHLPLLNHLAKGKISFLPLACDSGMHRKIGLTPQEKEMFGCDVCFIGTCLPERIIILKELLGYNLNVWGEGWQRERLWLKERYKGKASGEKMVKIYNASRIVLNIHHPQTIEGLNLRTFEVCGCGAFQLVDNRAILGKMYDIGREIVCFNDIKELKNLIDYYLGNEEERRGIAEAGYNKTHKEHTYLNRLERMFSIIIGEK